MFQLNLVAQASLAIADMEWRFVHKILLHDLASMSQRQEGTAQGTMELLLLVIDLVTLTDTINRSCFVALLNFVCKITHPVIVFEVS
jgi:hypothetical protein